MKKEEAEKESSYPLASRKKKNCSFYDGCASGSSSTRIGTGGREEHAGLRQKVYLLLPFLPAGLTLAASSAVFVASLFATTTTLPRPELQVPGIATQTQ